MTVTRKFTLALICGIILVHAISGAVRVHRERSLFEQDISRDARVLGRSLGHTIERLWQTGGEAQAMEIIKHATQQESHVHVRWVWLDGKANEFETPVANLKVLKPLSRGQSVVTRVAEGGGMLLTYVPVRVPVQRMGAIEIADPLADEQDYLEKSIFTAAISALVLVVLCGLLAAFLGYRLIGRPVSRLVAHARSVGRGEFEARLTLPVKDELGELAMEMDHMTENLQRARLQLEMEAKSRLAAIEQLRHADRLTTVGTLASGIAHELGTPINVIEGHAQLIREDPATDDRVKENIQIITRQCKRMAQIIRQLLDFSRRGSHKSVAADAREVARYTLKMVDPLLRKQNILTSLEECHDDAQTAITYNELQQVLLNIVMNAIHAMPDGGRLDLRVERRLAKQSENDHETEHVIVAIEDTGSGMEPETVNRAFEPFFTTKDVGEGTGLGLSVAFGIIKDHGGWLEVKSHPGRGSTFTLFLPAESTL